MDEPQNDPSHYKFGLFYFNRDDRRLFVPKRIPFFGLTLNFANPWALFICAAVLAWLAMLSH